MKKIYPVIFTQTEDGFLVEVPDLEILTEGKDLEDATYMAKDAIGLHGIFLEDRKQEIAKPSNEMEIDINKGTFVNLGKSFIDSVEVDFVEYRLRLEDE